MPIKTDFGLSHGSSLLWLGYLLFPKGGILTLKRKACQGEKSKARPERRVSSVHWPLSRQARQNEAGASPVLAGHMAARYVQKAAATDRCFPTIARFSHRSHPCRLGR